MPGTCGKCTRASENRAWDCPPRMADGRLFTDFRPRGDINLQYKQQAMEGSYEYRQYLLNNGVSIIDANRAAAATAAACGPCVQPYDIGTMALETDRVVCNTMSCTRVASGAAVPPGTLTIGTGREYGMSEQVQAYDRAFLQARMEEQRAQFSSVTNCCGCGSSLAGTGAITSVTSGSALPSRWAVPGAGTPGLPSDPSAVCTASAYSAS